MPPKKKDEGPERIYKGVYRNCGAWRARIWDVDHEVYLGHFADAKAAGRAYDVAAIRLRGADGALMDGLNHAIHDYLDALPTLLATPLPQVVDDLRAGGLSENPANSDKPLK